MTRWNRIAIVAVIGGALMAAGIGSGKSRDHAGQPAEPSAQTDEARIMKVIDRLTPEIGPMLSVPPEDGRFLRILAQSTGAKTVVEIGTSNGYSALWISMGLQNTGGKLTTFEIDAEKVKMARANFKDAGVDNIVTVVEGDAHQKIKDLKGPLDLVFIDAEKEGYPDYLKQLLPLVRPGGLILAHNTTNTRGPLKDFVETIKTHPNLVTTFPNPSNRGMSLSMKKAAAK